MEKYFPKQKSFISKTYIKTEDIFLKDKSKQMRTYDALYCKYLELLCHVNNFGYLYSRDWTRIYMLFMGEFFTLSLSEAALYVIKNVIVRTLAKIKVTALRD